MEKLKKILAPTDLSDLSLAGIRYALEMATSEGAEVIVYHVVEYEEANLRDEGFYAESIGPWLLRERKRLLAKFLIENSPDLIEEVAVYLEVEIGVPHERIVEKATKRGVDLIVMSTHGRTGLLHLLAGSVTERVVRNANCPVWSVQATKERKPVTVASGEQSAAHA